MNLINSMKRLDDILNYNLKIYQDSSFFSFSLDSIILARLCDIRKTDTKIIDLCTGNGVIPIILNKKYNKEIDCIEVQEKLVDLAKDSFKVNNITDINIFHGDLREFFDNKYNNYYDVVLCNPPYFKSEDIKGVQNLSYEKRIARHEILLNLDELFSCVKKILKNNGRFYMVHRTDRLIEIIDLLKKYNLMPKKIVFIHENINKESNLVFIESRLNGNFGLKIEKPFIMYNLDGSMTDNYKKINEEV